MVKVKSCECCNSERMTFKNYRESCIWASKRLNVDLEEIDSFFCGPCDGWHIIWDDNVLYDKGGFVIHPDESNYIKEYSWVKQISAMIDSIQVSRNQRTFVVAYELYKIIKVILEENPEGVRENLLVPLRNRLESLGGNLGRKAAAEERRTARRMKQGDKMV